MKTPLYTLGLGLLPLLSIAQETGSVPSPAFYIVPSAWRVTFLGVGAYNELRLGSKTTLASGINFQPNSTVEEYPTLPNMRSAFSYSFAPVLQTGVRYFYNFERRLGKQKSIRYNSGNYLSARVRYVTPPILRREDVRAPLPSIDGVYMDAIWGFQRTYRRNFYLNLSLGAGVGRHGFYPNIEFLLGYTFPTRSTN